MTGFAYLARNNISETEAVGVGTAGVGAAWKTDIEDVPAPIPAPIVVGTKGNDLFCNI